VYALCYVAVVCGDITRSPDNVAGVVGSNVTLRCAGTSLSWLEYISNETYPSTITGTNGEVYFPKEYDLITTPTGTYNLIIKSSELSDGGKYKCMAKRNYTFVEVVMFNGKIFSCVKLLLLYTP